MELNEEKILNFNEEVKKLKFVKKNTKKLLILNK